MCPCFQAGESGRGQRQEAGANRGFGAPPAGSEIDGGSGRLCPASTSRDAGSMAVRFALMTLAQGEPGARGDYFLGECELRDFRTAPAVSGAASFW